MEELLGLLVLGFCVWVIIRHPGKSLSFISKKIFLTALGFGTLLVLF